MIRDWIIAGIWVAAFIGIWIVIGASTVPDDIEQKAIECAIKNDWTYERCYFELTR